MRTLSLHPHRDDILAARTAEEAKPLPAPSASKPPNWGRDMIAFLRAEDNVPPMPATFRPLRSRTLIERLAFVSTAMHDDYARHLDTLRVIDEISAMGAASDMHVLRMALAPIAAQLTVAGVSAR